MKNLKIALISLSLFIVSCKKENQPPPQGEKRVVARFYSSNMVTSAKIINVTVNGSTLGRLKYSNGAPDCSADGFASTQLTAGSYTVGYVDSSNPQANKTIIINVQSSPNCQSFNIQ